AGIFFLLLAFLFACPDVLSLVSDGVYATLLVFVAIELGRHGIKTESYLVTGLIAALSVLVNMTLAFAAGMCLAYGIRYLNKRGRKNTKDQ
ncbi:MAG TPA: sulfate transporter, partial [Deltaproteobacteria bacterium]|nr:sulfate transporter [Deltaproteobacteria bacterium]